MKKLLLWDAYAIIYRAYYAFIRNPHINSKGLNTSAVFGFVNTFNDVVGRENPTHIAVAFDPVGPTFRHEMYKEYKAQREQTPEDIKISVPIIKEIIRAYNVPILEMPGFEADDVIGTISKQAEKKGFEVLMVTPDKDYGQLVTDRVFMYRPKHTGGFEKMGPEEIKKKFNVRSQAQIIDLLGLMGDSSDNIPGCPGVGDKTATKLLNDFGSIDALLERTGELKGALKKKIEDNVELIKFSRLLATIKTDVPVLLDEKELEVKQPNEEKIREIFEELEFRSFLKKLGAPEKSKTEENKSVSTSQMSLFDSYESDTNNGREEAHLFGNTEEMPGSILKTISDTEHSYRLIDTKDKRAELISTLFAQKSVCFDTETTGVNVFTSEMVGLSFCFKKGEACYVPLPDDKAAANEVLAEFKAFFLSEHIEKIGQNMKFDLLMLSGYGVELKGKLFDTMIAHYLIQPELRHGMDYLAEIYLKYRTIHYEDLVGPKGKKQADIRTVDLNALCDYASEDADITFQLKTILEEKLKKNDLENLFYEIEMPLMQVLVKMERTGVRIDSEALKQSSIILTDEMLQIENEIRRMAGVSFNISSAKQVGEILFDQMKIDEKAKKTKTGQYSTSEDVLEKLKSKHPIVEKILAYRGLKKLLSTYIDALPELINPGTGKVHTSYNQTVTSTGRLSSSNPNLQNIPIRDAQGKEIRKAFIPDDGSVFFSADYSQIELRIMAHLSEDENMLNAFNAGLDIHTATAAKIYKVDLDKVTSDMRRKAKTANFGIIYGISGFGLAERLNIPRSEAKDLIDGYFTTYSSVKAYMDASIRKAKENGYVETLLGRKRYLNDINSQNSIVRGYAERNAINAPIQGTAADIIKIAMVRIHQRFIDENIQAKMIMQVHDELNFTVPANELDKVKKLVSEEMEKALTLKVALIADTGVGKNWLEAH
ncbi:MAG: DNA polymerase I [Prevotellaceae bacterium]|jgi:DNA polymerase-1|nr:DNA polymerase I [Prevotellaceae bacterium]